MSYGHGRFVLWGMVLCVLIVPVGRQIGYTTAGETGEAVATAHGPVADVSPADRAEGNVANEVLLPAAIQAKLEPPHDPDRLLVRFKPHASRAVREAVHDAAGGTRVLREYHAVDALQLVEVSKRHLASTLAAYTRDPNVLYAEPDYVVCTTNAPNDPDFELLWGMYNWGQTVAGDAGTPGADIRALGAWGFWSGDPDFRIAVIDTGVNYDHPDLQANIWINPSEIPDNHIDDDGNGYIDDIHGYDFYQNDGDPMDSSGHGSHVSGTIGAVGNNDLGVVGVNWQCKIVGLRFLGGG